MVKAKTLREQETQAELATQQDKEAYIRQHALPCPLCGRKPDLQSFSGKFIIYCGHWEALGGGRYDTLFDNHTIRTVSTEPYNVALNTWNTAILEMEARTITKYEQGKKKKASTTKKKVVKKK